MHTFKPSSTPLYVVCTQVRVDHRNGTLHFGAQQLESDKIRNHLSLLARRLAKAVTMIEPGVVPDAVTSQKEASLALCRDNITKEHSRLLARKQVGCAWVDISTRNVCNGGSVTCWSHA